MNKQNDRILVFDSGLGGLSVLRELIRLMPGERYLYLGDSRNAPYGTRPTDEVRNLTFRAIEEEMEQGVKALVVACNTATTAAIEDLRQRYPDKIIIGVEPALKLAAEHCPGGRIVVMATGVTLREPKFCALMDRFSATCRIVPLPCPGLVEFVEFGQLDTPELRAYLMELLRPVLPGGIDAIVLGCTHFPFLKPVIQSLVGGQVEILDGAHGTAQQTRRRLKAEGLLRLEQAGEVELRNSLGTKEILSLSAKLLEVRL